MVPLTPLGYVVGVSDFLMLSLAKLTVKVGKEVINVVSESEVRLTQYTL